jgi:thiol-disulfide isomerase/thioredoxin
MSTRRYPTTRRRFLGTAAATIAGLELTMNSSISSLLRRLGGAGDGPLSALGGATTWLNSPPLATGDLRGKVVLVNFCTYTCINWLRQLPYVRAWAERYRDHRLAVIGVHTPEFGFEHDLDNVRRALQEMRVDYPIAIDNDYAIWSGFENRYWPALYLIDTKGTIRHTQFGEGGYEESERTVQTLLGEAGADGMTRDLAPVAPRGIEVAADWESLGSPENYLGSDRTEHFVSTRRSGAMYAAPDRLRLNEWALAGDWTAGGQAVALNQPNGRIVCRFHARDLHLVLGPASRGTSVRCRVRIDGQPPGGAHGGDIDEQGLGIVNEQRLYQLIRQRRPITDRDFEIEFLHAGVEAFAFTFG